jgi:hypothetical protein
MSNAQAIHLTVDLLIVNTYGRVTLTGMFREPQGPFTRTENTPALLLTDLTEYFIHPLLSPAGPSEKTAMSDQSGVVTATRPF